jgi:hypothetical protein
MWKKDADGNMVLDGDGNPVWVNATGQEQSVKGDAFASLNAEAKGFRVAKEAAEASLAKYTVDGKLIDPELAVKAVATVSKLDAKQLIDAGEVDKVRETIKAEYSAQIGERDKALETANGRINSMLVDGVFKGSEFIADRVAMPRDFFEAAMRSHFKVEDGQVFAYDKAGNRLMSKKSIGEYASPNEALELLVEAHPQKDTILRAQAAGGSGNNGGGGGRGAGRVVRRADFDAMPAAQQAEAAVAMGKGELTIAD